MQSSVLLVYFVHSCWQASLVVRERMLFVELRSKSCDRRTFPKCFASTRLETRTKESNMCASVWGVIPSAK